jgi:hypothetical protein
VPAGAEALEKARSFLHDVIMWIAAARETVFDAAADHASGLAMPSAGAGRCAAGIFTRSVRQGP